jgi:hypothetical protein
MYSTMATSAATQPAIITTRTKRDSRASSRTVSTTMKNRMMLSKTSAKWRTTVCVGGAWPSPATNEASASARKISTGRPTEAVISLPCRPVTRRSSQTPNSAIITKSRNVGLKPISIGSAPNGSRQMMAISAT